MKFLIEGRNYDANNQRDLNDATRLAALVEWGFRATAAPPRFVLAQVQSMWRWVAGERKWYL